MKIYVNAEEENLTFDEDLKVKKNDPGNYFNRGRDWLNKKILRRLPENYNRLVDFNKFEQIMIGVIYTITCLLFVLIILTEILMIGYYASSSGKGTFFAEVVLPILFCFIGAIQITFLMARIQFCKMFPPSCKYSNLVISEDEKAYNWILGKFKFMGRAITHYAGEFKDGSSLYVIVDWQENKFIRLIGKSIMLIIWPYVCIISAKLFNGGQIAFIDTAGVEDRIYKNSHINNIYKQYLGI